MHIALDRLPEDINIHIQGDGVSSGTHVRVVGGTDALMILINGRLVHTKQWDAPDDAPITITRTT